MIYKEITPERYRMLSDRSGAYRVRYEFGNLSWYVDGKCHRDDGPARIRSHFLDDGSTKEWYQNGKRHRADGPALIKSSGKTCWYLNGTRYSKEEWFSKLTPEQLAIALGNTENF